MEYKAYYNFKATADTEQEINSINFDWVNLASYRFDVHDADGFGWEGKDINCSGSFTFECEEYNEDTDDYEPGGEINWDNFEEELRMLEATFSVFDEEFEPIRFGEEEGDECEFELIIYNGDKKYSKKTTGVFYGNTI